MTSHHCLNLCVGQSPNDVEHQGQSTLPSGWAQLLSGNPTLVVQHFYHPSALGPVSQRPLWFKSKQKRPEWKNRMCYSQFQFRPKTNLSGHSRRHSGVLPHKAFWLLKGRPGLYPGRHEVSGGRGTSANDGITGRRWHPHLHV